MTRHARYAVVFSALLLIAALGFAGLGSAQAQQGQPTQTPGAGDQNQQGQVGAGQGANTIGGILGQFALTEEQVRQILVDNPNLELDAGQTVTFPASIVVTGAAQATAAPGAGASAGQGAAGQAAAGQTTGFNCAAGQSTPGQAVATQAGDTLGRLLGMMGLNAQGQGAVTTNQLVEFVYLNCDMRIVAGRTQTVVVPAGVSQAGTAQQGVGPQSVVPQTGQQSGQQTQQGAQQA